MAVVVILPLSSLFADQFRSSGTGNWGTNGTWQISTNGGSTWAAATRTPGSAANDTVLIRNGHTVTLNVSPANALAILTIGEGTSGALSIGGQIISVNGSVTANNGATVTVTSATGTKSFGNVVLNSGATWNSNAGETYSISGNLTLNGANIGGTRTGVFNVGTDFLVSGTNSIAAATLSVTGSTVVNGSLTFSSTTGTKTFNNVTINSGGQWNSTAAETYTIGGSLTMNGGTIDGTATGIFNVSGNFDVASGTNTLGNATITVTGTTNINGTLNITSSTGTKTFAGKVTISNGGTWDNSTGNSAIVLRGGLENNGTFTSGTGTYTFNTNSQTIGGTNGLTFAGTGTSIAITGAITITNQTTVTVAGSITGSAAGSTWLNDANSTLNVAGALLATGTLTATATPNLVNYNGTGAQTIKAANYNNLTISGSRATNNVTLANGGTIGISGTFTPSATFTTGNYVSTGNTVDFNGSGAQSIPALGATNYNNLTHSGSGTATLAEDIGIAGNLTVSGGTLDLSSFTADRASAGGTLTVGAGAMLRIGSTNTLPANYTTYTLNVTSTVEYYGSTQTIAARTYGNLVLSGSGPKTTPTGTTTTTVAGNFTLGAGITYERASGATSTLTLNGTTNVNDGTLGSLANPFNTINIGNAGGDNLTNNGIMAVATALAGSGSLTQGTNATLYIGGTFTTTTVTLTADPNLVEYNGTGAQTIRATNYNNLTISGARTTNNVTFAAGTVGVSGSLTLLATFTSGTYVTTGNTVALNGTGAQSITGTMTFTGLTVGAFSVVTVNDNITVNGTLTLNNDLDMGSNTLTLGSAATVTSTGDVLGTVFRSGLTTGTAYAFNNQYTTITFSGSAPTNVTSVLTRGSAPAGKSDAIQRYYTLSHTGGFGTATLRLRYLDSELNGNTELDLVLWKDVSGTWTEQGRTGSVDATNNFVELSGVTSLSAWTLANNSLDHFAVSFASPQNAGTPFTGTNTITAQDAGNRTVTRFNAATNNVTVTATPNNGTISGLGSGNNNVLNQASDFVNGVANVTGSLTFSGLTGDYTFTATSANGKTGTSGTVTINASTTNWVGGTSNNWNDPANWSNGIPGAGTKVVIGSATFRPRIPTTGASTFDLTINNGGYLEWESCGGVLNIYGKLTIVNGGTMDLGTCTPSNQVVFHGNFTINNGGSIVAGNGTIDLKGASWQNNPGSSFDPGTSTVIIDGTGDQTISGDITFYNLIVDNSTGTVTLTDDVVVENDMTITAGSTVDVSGGGTLTVVGDFNNQGSVPTDKPYIVSATAVSTTQVDVTFNEPVQQTSAETATNYSIRLQSGGTLSISSAVRDGTNTAVVHLTPSSALTPGNVDTLVVNNVQDLSGGNVIQANSRKRITSAALNVFYSRASGNWNDVNTWSLVSHTGAAATRLPGSVSGDSVVIGNSHTITLDVNVTNLNLVRVNSTGTLNTGTFVVSGSGAFELNAGGTLGIGSPDGITSSGATGNIQVSGSRTFSTAANYTYNGTSAQVTGNGLPSTINSLTINNASGVTLTASTSLTGDLTVSSGTFDLGAHSANRSSSGGTLTLSAGTTLKIGGTGSLPSNYASHAISSSSTVEYSGTNQSVVTLNSSQNYGTLVISGSGTKTLSGNIGIVNDLTISGGTFDLGTFTANRTASGGSLTLSSGTTLTVGGSSGGLTGSNFPSNFSTLVLNGTVEYNGTGVQTIAPLAYTHVLFNNGGTKTIDGTITFNGDFTVNTGAVVVVAPTGDIQINGNLVVSGSFTNNGTISIGN